MNRLPKVGHQQKAILKALYDYAEQYPVRYLSRKELLYRAGLNWHSRKDHATFSRAITLLANHGYARVAGPSTSHLACIEEQRNLTEDDYLHQDFDSYDGRHHYYRITEAGTYRFDNLDQRSRRKTR